jgi:uncharacterized protein
MKQFVIACIRWYQLRQTPLHARCRFHPTCSEYMVLAVQKYGVGHGIWLGVKRITHCRQPNGGVDYP